MNLLSLRHRYTNLLRKLRMLGIIPENSDVAAFTQGIQWNYTTVLNIIFLALAAVLVIRFIRTGGASMLTMMKRPAHKMDHHPMDHQEMSH